MDKVIDFVDILFPIALSGPRQDGQGPDGGVFTFVPHAGILKAKKAGARTWK
jgi:hypothetical protein